MKVAEVAGFEKVIASLLEYSSLTTVEDDNDCNGVSLLSQSDLLATDKIWIIAEFRKIANYPNFINRQ